MTDAAIIQILSRFAAHQVCPSLGNTWPCCPLPAWLRVTAPWDRWSCKEAGGQQGRWPTPLHTQLLSPEPREKGIQYSDPALQWPQQPRASLLTLLPAPKCNHTNLGSPLRKTKHAIHHSNTSFPALLLWNTRFLKAALPLHWLCTTSQAAHPKPRAPPPTAPATAQPSTRCCQDLLHKALSPTALEQLSPHPRTTSAVHSNTQHTHTHLPYVLLSPLQQQHQFRC